MNYISESNALPEEQRKPPGFKNEVYLTHPREKPPQPSEYEPLNLSFSPIPQKKPEKEMDDHLDISSDESEVLEGEEVTDEEHVASVSLDSVFYFLMYYILFQSFNLYEN